MRGAAMLHLSLAFAQTLFPTKVWEYLSSLVKANGMRLSRTCIVRYRRYLLGNLTKATMIQAQATE